MFSIQKATEADFNIIAEIGRVSVAESHKGSCPDEIMNEFLDNHYSDEEIKTELLAPGNIYHLLLFNNKPAGFSKIIFNAKHLNIVRENTALLDRIYLLKEFHGNKLGLELIKFNIELCNKNNQSGIWLYVWMGNKRAIDFYSKAGFKIIGNQDFHVAREHYDPSYQMFLDFNENGIV